VLVHPNNLLAYLSITMAGLKEGDKFPGDVVFSYVSKALELPSQVYHDILLIPSSFFAQLRPIYPRVRRHNVLRHPAKLQRQQGVGR
jgi:hypothetical protein